MGAIKAGTSKRHPTLQQRDAKEATTTSPRVLEN
jgi:hypothetical protein